MSDGYLLGAVSQYRASKRSFLGGTKPFGAPKTCKPILK